MKWVEGKADEMANYAAMRAGDADRERYVNHLKFCLLEEGVNPFAPE